jgi:RHH-type rel operon transcriptional repressor/antitoxin RelB
MSVGGTSVMARTTTSIDIGEEIDRQLDQLAIEIGQDKRAIARNALIEWLEDLEDARDAGAILERNEPSSSIHDVRKRLGLER